MSLFFLFLSVLSVSEDSLMNHFYIFIKPICVFSSGGTGAVDRKRRPDSGEQRPDLPAAEDSFRTDSVLPHPADLPLHL